MRASLTDRIHTSYTAFDDEKLIGVTTLRWVENESEIAYIAVASGLRSQVTALLNEACCTAESNT